MRLITLSSLALLAAALALVAPNGAYAQTKNCRQCSCTLTFYNTYWPLELDGFMNKAVTKKITGGGGWSWSSPPVAQGESHVGTAYFPRLCGTSKSADKSWDFNYWSGGKTTVAASCTGCGKNVKCNGGSSCEDSGLYG